MSGDLTNDELIEILADGQLCESDRCLSRVPNACTCALAAERLKEALGKLDEERQYSERMLAAYQEAHRQATENGAAYHALASRLDSAENAMREVVGHLQRSQRGSTHWAGCPDVHPVCQAIDMLVDALPLRDLGSEPPRSEECDHANAVAAERVPALSCPDCGAVFRRRVVETNPTHTNPVVSGERAEQHTQDALPVEKLENNS